MGIIEELEEHVNWCEQNFKEQFPPGSLNLGAEEASKSDLAFGYLLKMDELIKAIKRNNRDKIKNHGSYYNFLNIPTIENFAESYAKGHLTKKEALTNLSYFRKEIDSYFRERGYNPEPAEKSFKRLMKGYLSEESEKAHIKLEQSLQRLNKLLEKERPRINQEIVNVLYARLHQLQSK